jgi:hypothetical protein
MPAFAVAQSSLPPCPADEPALLWTNCTGTFNTDVGISYSGEWKDGQFGGQGTLTYQDGGQYIGGFRGYRPYGQGTLKSPKGYTLAEGFWLDENTVDTSGGRWEIVASAEDATKFVLTQSIKKDGAFRRAWEMGANGQPDADGWLSIRSLNSYDCTNERSRHLDSTTHSGSFGAGKVVRSYGESSWMYNAPGTVGYIVMKYVCNYDLNTKK